MVAAADTRPEVSLVVLNWNTRRLLVRSVKAALDAAHACDAECIVVDNGSRDGSVHALRKRFPEVDVVALAENRGPAHGFNAGIERARGDVVVLLNTDAFLTAEALEALLAVLADGSGYGAAVPRLLNADGTTQRGVMRFPRLATLLCHDSLLGLAWPANPERRHYFMEDFDHETSCDVDQPPQAVFAVRADVIDAVGRLDVEMPIYFNDVDWCLRIREAGWRIRYVAETPVVHLGGASAGRLVDRSAHIFRDRVRYARKHFGPHGARCAKLALHSFALGEAVRCLCDRRASWGRRREQAARALALARRVHREA